MQYYSPSGALIGKRDKSHMAEFSSNPDSRKKGEVSFETYMKRLKEQKSCSDSYRVTINKIRNMKGLLTFKDIDEFLQIIDESDFDIGDDGLQKYLLEYEIQEPPVKQEIKPSIKQVQENEIKKISSEKVVQPNDTPETIAIDVMKFLKKIVPYYENNLQTILVSYQTIKISIDQYANSNNVLQSDKDKLFEINMLLKNAFTYSLWSSNYEKLTYETFVDLFEYYLKIKRAKKAKNRNQLVKISEALLRVQRSILSLNPNSKAYDSKIKNKLNELKERYVPINE